MKWNLNERERAELSSSFLMLYFENDRVFYLVHEMRK